MTEPELFTFKSSPHSARAGTEKGILVTGFRALIALIIVDQLYCPVDGWNASAGQLARTYVPQK
jgi:hypothetical protein